MSKGNRKRSKKSSLGPDLRKIKQGLKQLGADHEKMLGNVLFLFTINIVQNNRYYGEFDERTWITWREQRWVRIRNSRKKGREGGKFQLPITNCKNHVE